MNSVKARPVLKYDSQGVYKKRYKSEYSAAKALKINRSCICRALKNGYKAGGYYWRYDEGDHAIHIDVKVRTGKKVQIFNLQGLHITTAPSIAQASLFTKIPESTIRSHLDGSSLKKSSFIFKKG